MAKEAVGVAGCDLIQNVLHVVPEIRDRVMAGRAKRLPARTYKSVH